MITMTDRTTLMMLTVTGLCLVTGCGKFNAEGDFKKAKTENSIEGYQTFLNTHPDSQFTVVASNALQQLQEEKAWFETTNTPSIVAFQAFLKKHSASTHAEQAKTQAATLFAEEWKAIHFRFNEQDYRDFVALQPPTPLLDEAKLMQRILDQAKKLEATGLKLVEGKVKLFYPQKGAYGFHFDKLVDTGPMLVQDLWIQEKQSELVSQQESFESGDAVLLVIGTSRSTSGSEVKIIGVLKKQ